MPLPASRTLATAWVYADIGDAQIPTVVLCSQLLLLFIRHDNRDPAHAPAYAHSTNNTTQTPSHPRRRIRPRPRHTQTHPRRCPRLRHHSPRARRAVPPFWRRFVPRSCRTQPQPWHRHRKRDYTKAEKSRHSRRKFPHRGHPIPLPISSRSTAPTRSLRRLQHPPPRLPPPSLPPAKTTRPPRRVRAACINRRGNDDSGLADRESESDGLLRHDEFQPAVST